MFKSTPWKQGEDGFGVYVEDTRGHVIADVRMPEPEPGEKAEQNMERHRARARVMAVSPELLEALKQAVEDCPCSVKERASGHRIGCRAPEWDELIYKAEGVSS